MDWTTYLFRFDGRINRAMLWQALLIVALLAGVLGLIGQAIGMVEGAKTFKINVDFDFSFGLDELFKVVDPQAYRPTLFLKTLGLPLFLWIYLATAIKRLHDRDRSGWWIVPLFFVPHLLFHFSDRLPDANWFVPFDWAIYALWLWGLVELFILRGTSGDNRFGPDPLAEHQTDAGRARGTGWDQQREIEFIPPSANPPGGMRRA